MGKPVKVHAGEHCENGMDLDLNELLSEVATLAKVELRDIHLPAHSQFSTDGSFTQIKPMDTSKMYYIGNCTKCGLTVKYTNHNECLQCKRLTNSKRDLSRYGKHRYEHTTKEERESGIKMILKVYVIYNKTTGARVYVGSTKHQLVERERGHRLESEKNRDRAIYKHVHSNGGWDNFKFKTLYEQLVTHDTPPSRVELELELLRLYEHVYIQDIQGLFNTHTINLDKAKEKNDLMERLIDTLEECSAMYKEIEKELGIET